MVAGEVTQNALCPPEFLSFLRTGGALARASACQGAPRRQHGPASAPSSPAPSNLRPRPRQTLSRTRRLRGDTRARRRPAARPRPSASSVPYLLLLLAQPRVTRRKLATLGATPAPGWGRGQVGRGEWALLLPRAQDRLALRWGSVPEELDRARTGHRTCPRPHRWEETTRA